MSLTQLFFLGTRMCGVGEAKLEVSTRELGTALSVDGVVVVVVPSIGS